MRGFLLFFEVDKATALILGKTVQGGHRVGKKTLAVLKGANRH